MSRHYEINALGLKCPLPVLRIQKQMRQLAPGDVLCVTADDPAALIDVPHFCNERGHLLIRQDDTDEGHLFVIRKQ